MCFPFQEGFANDFIGEMALAFETASGDARKGVEHAEVVEGIGNEGFAEDFCADIGDDSADLGGCKLLGGLEAAEALLFADEIEGEFLAETALLEEALLADIILVSARFPTPDVLGVETFSGNAELSDELGKGEAVVEPGEGARLAAVFVIRLKLPVDRSLNGTSAPLERTAVSATVN